MRTTSALRWLSLVLLWMSGEACGGRPYGAGVAVAVSKQHPPGSAMPIGQVRAVSGNGCGKNGRLGSKESAIDQLRFEASGLGANYVQIVSVSQSSDPKSCNEFTATGLAFDTRRRATQQASQSAPKSPLVKRAQHSGLDALGSPTPRPGCLAGRIYQLSGRTKLPSDYANQVPAQRLWSCDFQLAGLDGAEMLPQSSDGPLVVRYQGRFNAKKGGIYRFGFRTSTQLRVTIDGAAAVDAPQATRAETELFLGKGSHQVVIEFVLTRGNLDLSIQSMLPGAAIWIPFSTRPKSPFHMAQYNAEQQQLSGNRSRGRASLERERAKLVSVGAHELELHERIYFHTGSSEIGKLERSEQALNALLQTLTTEEQVRCLEIAGHTDDRGTREFNRRLSLLRAQAVRSWLVDRGIEPHRLSVRGIGAAQPVRRDESEAARAENRRVQFAVKTPQPDGSCPPGDKLIEQRPHARPAAGAAQVACQQLQNSAQQLKTQLASWVSAHRECLEDEDCLQVIPVECVGKNARLSCTQVAVNRTHVEDLRVQGARLDASTGYCEGLPENNLIRSCGGCEASAPHCVEGTCQ